MLQFKPSDNQLLDGQLCACLAQANGFFSLVGSDPLVFYSGSLNLTGEEDVGSPDILQSLDAKDSDWVLTVSAQALHLEKLRHVKRLLYGYIEFSGYQLQSSRSFSGNMAKAKASILQGAAVAKKLKEVSQTLQLDIAMIKGAPKLAEAGLVVFDMDSTLIQMECIDEIAKLANVGDKVAEVTELAMQGKLDFAQSLHHRVGCIKDVDVTLLKGIRDRIPLMPGAAKLIGTLQQHGWKVAIASGGFTFFADYLKQRLNLDYAVSNQLAIADGKLIGKVVGEVVDAAKKAATLAMLRKEYGIPESQTIAVGDGANDLKMMLAAGLGIAYHAKPVVGEQADAAVSIGGLDIALDFLQ